MDWLIAGIITLIAAYLVVAFVIHRMGWFRDNITFYGPLIALKTTKVGFFDGFVPYARWLRWYGSFGVFMVAVVSIFVAASLLISLGLMVSAPPTPTGIFAPRNILLIPGLNEYVPSTLAVWFAFVVAITIHEFGHGVLCRVEGIPVKGMGIIFFVLPIGFFVEPDDEELQKKPGMPKVRMFGAGITNNLVIGVICFAGMILVAGTAIPVAGPVIGGLYADYPAANAGVPPDSLITAINGVAVQSREDVSAILNTTKPGDTIALQVETGGGSSTYTFTLGEWPNGTTGNPTTGFMGVEYYDPPGVIATVKESFSPLGFLRLITVPFSSMTSNSLRVIAFSTSEEQFYVVPFASSWFWGLVHALFWLGWINLNLGIFNALPMVPLDGGYIMKEGVDRLSSRWGFSRYANAITSAISTVMLFAIFSIILIPYIAQL